MSYSVIQLSVMSRLFNFILDLLFPRAPLVRELESLDACTFVARAEKTGGYAGKNIISLFSYRDPLIRQAVWELKYRGNKKIARLLAEALYDELLAFLEEYAPLTNFTEPLLIPIPLSRKRESERGFNQCHLVCEEMTQLDGGNNFTLALTALRKTKDTPSQTKAENKEFRIKNLEGCFAADAATVRGRNIILIDDVATTGATLFEARRALRKAEARKVIAFTVAH